MPWTVRAFGLMCAAALTALIVAGCAQRPGMTSDDTMEGPKDPPSIRAEAVPIWVSAPVHSGAASQLTITIALRRSTKERTFMLEFEGVPVSSISPADVLEDPRPRPITVAASDKDDITEVIVRGKTVPRREAKFGVIRVIARGVEERSDIMLVKLP